jgi:hypothetical protein
VRGGGGGEEGGEKKDGLGLEVRSKGYCCMYESQPLGSSLAKKIFGKLYRV